MNNREPKLRTSYLKTTLIKYAKIQYNQHYYLYIASTHSTTTHTSSYMYVCRCNTSFRKYPLHYKQKIHHFRHE